MREKRTVQDRLAALEAMLQRQRDEMTQQQEEISRLRAALGRHPNEGTGEQGMVEAESPRATKVSRRQVLLKLGGTAAAAGVAATAATLMQQTPTAHAADLNNFVLGTSNTATHDTILNDDGTGIADAVLEANSTSYSYNTSALTAVAGLSPFGGVGVYGGGYDDTTNNLPGIGVYGYDSGGVGLAGESTTGIALLLLGTARIYQGATLTHAGPPVTADGTFGTFEQIRDSNGAMWLSTVAPDSSLRWVRTGVVNGSANGGAMNFLPSPVRIIGAGSPPGVTLAKNTHTNFTLAGNAGIPADAKAVFGNATVYNASGSGFVTLYPKGGSASTSSLNFTSTDQPLSNFVATALSADGAITVFVSNNVNVKFIFDVVGYCL